MAIIVIFTGLWTFFAPAITTDPPVLGRAAWSPLDILTQIHDGELPIHTENDFEVAGVEIHFVGAYLLLLLALLTVTFFPLAKLLAVFALLGALFGVGTDSRYGPNDFVCMFYGSLNSRIGHVHLGQHKLMLLAVNLLLLGIVFLPDRH